MGDYDINWIALLVAAASSLVVGFVWYGPYLVKLG